MASKAIMARQKIFASRKLKCPDQSLMKKSEANIVAGIPQTSKRMPVEYIKLSHSGVRVDGFIWQLV